MEAFLPGDQAGGVCHRLNEGYDADLSGDSKPEGCEIGVWGDCLFQDAGGDEATGVCDWRRPVPRRAAAVFEGTCLCQCRVERPGACLRAHLKEAAGRMGG